MENAGKWYSRLSVATTVVFITWYAFVSAWSAMDPSDAEPGKPLSSALMQGVLNRLNDHETKLTNLSYSGGNVGIGVSNPSSSLSVNGEISAGTAGGYAVFHRGNLVLIQCSYTWSAFSGWSTHNWVASDCGNPSALPSTYAKCMRAVSGNDWSIWGRLNYCDVTGARAYNPSSSQAFVRCDYLCWN